MNEKIKVHRNPEQCPLCLNDAESGTLVGCTACFAKHHADCVGELSSDNSCGACSADLEHVVSKSSESFANSAPRTKPMFSFKEKFVAIASLATVFGLLYFGFEANPQFKSNNPSKPLIRHIYDVADQKGPIIFNHSYNNSAPFEVKVTKQVCKSFFGDEYPKLRIDFNLDGDSGFIFDGDLDGLDGEFPDMVLHKSFPTWTCLNSPGNFEKYTMQTFYKNLLEAANTYINNQASDSVNDKLKDKKQE